MNERFKIVFGHVLGAGGKTYVMDAFSPLRGAEGDEEYIIKENMDRLLFLFAQYYCDKNGTYLFDEFAALKKKYPCGKNS